MSGRLAANNAKGSSGSSNVAGKGVSGSNEMRKSANAFCSDNCSSSVNKGCCSSACSGVLTVVDRLEQAARLLCSSVNQGSYSPAFS